MYAFDVVPSQSGLHNYLKKIDNLHSLNCYYHVKDAWNRKKSKFISSLAEDQVDQVERTLQLGAKAACENADFYGEFKKAAMKIDNPFGDYLTKCYAGTKEKEPQFDAITWLFADVLDSRFDFIENLVNLSRTNNPCETLNNCFKHNSPELPNSNDSASKNLYKVIEFVLFKLKVGQEEYDKFKVFLEILLFLITIRMHTYLDMYMFLVYFFVSSKNRK